MSLGGRILVERKRLASVVRRMRSAFSSRPREITESAGARHLSEAARSYSNLDGWLERAAGIQRGILAGAGLSPMPTGGQLNAKVRLVQIARAFTVESVAFESFPGFFVTGNLYRPPQEREEDLGRLPAVLVPHGHTRWWRAPMRGRFAPEIQIFCSTLASMGAVALAYDMVGWGESRQLRHTSDRNVFAYQLWNSLRGVDLLLSLPYVDPGRIAVVGHSGGATQALFLTGVDSRLALSVLVSQVSAHFFGGCICERGLPIHQGPHHRTNNAEVAALAAPRPQLLISNGLDWTRNTPRVEYPHIRRIYALHRAEDMLENVHFPDEGHGFGVSQREAAYRFLRRHLGMGPAPEKVRREDIEPEIAVLPPKDLWAFPSAHERPTGALRGRRQVRAAFRQLRRAGGDLGTEPH